MRFSVSGSEILVQRSLSLMLGSSSIMADSEHMYDVQWG